MKLLKLLSTSLILLVLGTGLLFAKNPVVEMHIEIQNKHKPEHGVVKIELFEKESPVTVKNFLGYVNSGFYNGTIFHRVINRFMIQGGGFDRNLSQKKTRSPIKNEAHNKLNNTVGTIAMARTNNIHSATAQFFINVNNNLFLDHKNKQKYGYAVFGRVISGMDIVHKIQSVKTGKKGVFSDVPLAPVLIKKVVLSRSYQ
ncbi:peptidylprolyl isomerase A [Candidatus Marinamargulisbacteria bacterium SCGC AG-439-L15]|nr:peptidylprolyl isomerase A [Candidatus Marinamargulisbacteria bacterium SCGC AG-439-L15]